MKCAVLFLFAVLPMAASVPTFEVDLNFFPQIALAPPGTNGPATIPMIIARSGVRVTISQQGLEVLKTASGRKLKGVAVAAVRACNLDPRMRPIEADEIYQAIETSGIETLLAADSADLLARSAETSLQQAIIDGIGLTSEAVGLAGATKTLKLGNGASLALIFAPTVLKGITNYAQKRSARPATVTDHILKGSYSLAPHGSPGSCITDGKLILYHYFGKWSGKREIVIE